MKIYIAITCLFLLLIPSVRGVSQEHLKGIEIGEKLPDLPVLLFTNADHDTISKSHYQGKFLILDFWATWCGPCITSLSKMSLLQKKYSQDLNIILVSAESKNTIDNFFAVYKKTKGLDLKLGSVYKDRLLTSYFPHATIPHYVWIDKFGIVKAITSSEEVNDVNINKFTKSERLSLTSKGDRNRFDISETFFNERLGQKLFSDSGTVERNGIKYKAVITRNVKGFRNRGGNFTGRLLSATVPIAALFRQAYEYSFGEEIGPVAPGRLKFEVSDIGLYDAPKGLDINSENNWLENHSYIYDLVLPDFYQGLMVGGGKADTVRRIQCEIMKKNLERCFKLNSRLENRYVECLVLKSIDSTKHNSAKDFGPAGYLPVRSGYISGKTTVKNLLMNLQLPLQNEPPLIDETNYEGIVNIRLDAQITDPVALNVELRKFGFDLRREVRRIQVIIVSDN